MKLLQAMTAAIALLMLSAGDWPAFRGPSGNGLSSEKRAPLSWGSDKNVKWRVALPQPCNGSPIVSNGRVFTTCAEDPDGRRRSLYCFDRKDGKKLWVRTVNYGKKMPTHRLNKYCGSTPVADGRRVVVWHSSAGLYCYDFEGKELWKRNLGEFRHMWGYGGSPVLHDGKIFLNCTPGKRLFMIAVDLETGKTLWKVDEPFKGTGDRTEEGKLMGSWVTPIVAEVGGRVRIISAMPRRVLAYDPDDGSIVWFVDGLRQKRGDLAYSSPVVAGDICMIFGGYQGPAFGIRLGGKGDVTKTHQVWRVKEGPSTIGTGVFVDGYIYHPLSGGGMIECLDPKTGKSLWRERTSNAKQWGSVVTAAGRLYVMNQRGMTVVFKPNPGKLEILARNEIGETTNSTPAFSNGEAFIQTHEALYCIAE